MLEAICLRLKPVLFTKHTFLVYEGGLVDEMLFIIRGKLLSCTTNGGQSGFFHSFGIGPGDLCGEELLTWAFDPRPSVIRPSATHSVQATSEVEAFALIAEDLKVVASRFGRLHSKQLRPKLRHSHQWRTWAACIVQAAWRSYRIQKITAELKAKESLRTVAALTEDMKVHSDKNVPSPSSGFSICVQQG